LCPKLLQCICACTNLQRAREVRQAGELVAGYVEVEQKQPSGLLSASPSGTGPENWMPDSTSLASVLEKAL
jgi:hypothetical protein